MTIHIHVHAKSKDGSPPSKENVEKFAPQAPASLKSHKMWNKNDYAYFRGKGYSDSEIKKLWDRDSKTGTNPVTWNMDKKSKDAEGYNARLAKQLPKRVENLIAKIDSLNQLKTKLTSVLRDANALAAKVDKLTDQELSKEFEKIDMGSITGAEKVL